MLLQAYETYCSCSSKTVWYISAVKYKSDEHSDMVEQNNVTSVIVVNALVGVVRVGRILVGVDIKAEELLE